MLYSQVNGVNVVKVGHKQVVNLIRQGGGILSMKVVSVSRKPESEEAMRRRGRCTFQGLICSYLVLRRKCVMAALKLETKLCCFY